MMAKNVKAQKLFDNITDDLQKLDNYFNEISKLRQQNEKMKQLVFEIIHGFGHAAICFKEVYHNYMRKRVDEPCPGTEKFGEGLKSADKAMAKGTKFIKDEFDE